MRRLLPAAVVIFLTGVALAQESTGVRQDETANLDRANDKAQAESVANSKDPDEFDIPPGFKAKKRGELTVYCIKGKATGTRFQTETCYDKDQLHQYLLAREQNNRDMEQSRSVCGTAAICSPQ